jgi:hypothetical protein
MPKEYGTAGPRAIYPDLCDSRTLARCGLMANALFPRLIIQADDQGRIHGDATDVAALCFPKMPRVHRDIPKAMNELVSVGAVIAYEVDGEPYVQVTSWWQYQGHQRRAYPSRHPAPEGWEDRVYGLWSRGKDGSEDPSGDLPQSAADSGEPRPASRSLPPVQPQSAATRAGAVPSPSVLVSPIQSGSVPPRERGTTNGLSTIDGKKKPPPDEERAVELRAMVDDPATPSWKRDAAIEQLKVMKMWPAA